MKHSVLFAATAVLALGACQKTEPAANATPAAETNAVAEAPAAPTNAAMPIGPVAFVAGEAPSREFMVGTWSDGDACELPLNFQADGTIKDGPFPKWDLKDGYLTMEGAPQKMKLTVVDDKTMESQMDGSEKRTIKRC